MFARFVWMGCLGSWVCGSESCNAKTPRLQSRWCPRPIGLVARIHSFRPEGVIQGPIGSGAVCCMLLVRDWFCYTRAPVLEILFVAAVFFKQFVLMTPQSWFATVVL